MPEPGKEPETPPQNKSQDEIPKDWPYARKSQYVPHDLTEAEKEQMKKDEKRILDELERGIQPGEI